MFFFPFGWAHWVFPDVNPWGSMMICQKEK